MHQTLHRAIFAYISILPDSYIVSWYLLQKSSQHDSVRTKYSLQNVHRAFLFPMNIAISFSIALGDLLL
jgi:hypothetical protein